MARHSSIPKPAEPTSERRLVHHERQHNGTILTRIVATGPLTLDPPGLSVDLTGILS